MIGRSVFLVAAVVAGVIAGTLMDSVLSGAREARVRALIEAEACQVCPPGSGRVTCERSKP